MIKKESIGSLIWRCIYPFLLFIAAEFVVELIVMLIYVVPKMTDGSFLGMESDAIVDESMNFIYANALYITIGRTLILIPLLMMFMKRDVNYDIYLERHTEYEPFNRKWLLILVPVGVGAAIGFNGLISLSGIIKYSKSYQEIENIVYSGNIAIQLLASGVAAPLAEEFLFRGLLHKRIRHFLKPVPCMIISSAVFGLIPGNIVQFVYAFLIGMLLAYVYEIFKTIWAPVILHSAANTSAVLLTEFVPAIDGELTVGGLMIISVISLAVTFLGLKCVDMKVDRKESVKG